MLILAVQVCCYTGAITSNGDTLLTNPNTAMDTISNAEVRQIFGEIIADKGFTQDPEVLCLGSPTWVIKTGVSSAPEDQVAIRLRHDADPQALMQQIERQVGLVRDLRRLGARVVEFLDDPWMEPGDSSCPGGYVASMSRFLPGKAGDYQHAAGLATMHDASRQLDLSGYEPMDPLVSITDVKGALLHVYNRQAQGKPFKIGDVTVHAGDVENMERAYHEANALRRCLFQTAQENGSELVIVQEDVHVNNRALSYDGVGTVLDIDPYVGPAAMDFGRMENDMPRFAMPRNYAPRHQFRAGYKQTVRSGQLPPKEERELASQFSHLRTPLIMTSLAINAVRNGQNGDSWQLNEGLYRLGTLKQDVLWHSDDNARRLRDRAAQEAK